MAAVFIGCHLLCTVWNNGILMLMRGGLKWLKNYVCIRCAFVRCFFFQGNYAEDYVCWGKELGKIKWNKQPGESEKDWRDIARDVSA